MICDPEIVHWGPETQRWHSMGQTTVVEIPHRWGVRCCTELAARPWRRGPTRDVVWVGTEAAAIRLLADHVSECHGIPVVGQVVITDAWPCLGEEGDGCIAAVVLDPDPPCSECDNAEVIASERTVQVDTYTVEATS